MRPSYLLAASLAVAVVSTALLPSPAGAGTITKDPSKATHVIPCGDGSGKSARLWFTHTSEPTGEYLGNVHYRGAGESSWAADNPCTKWMLGGPQPLRGPPLRQRPVPPVQGVLRR